MVFKLYGYGYMVICYKLYGYMVLSYIKLMVLN